MISGRNSPNHVRINASVKIGGNGPRGGSGTLVAPDLVLTNGHVLKIDPPDNDEPDFSITNSRYPDRWYDVPEDINLRVAVTVAQGGPYAVTLTGRSRGSRTTLRIARPDGTGAVRSGDEIGLKTVNDRYLTVEGGRCGGKLIVDWSMRNRYGEWQQLLIEKISGSDGDAIQPGDKVALRARDEAYIGACGSTNPVLFAKTDSLTPENEFMIVPSDFDFTESPITYNETVGFIKTGGSDWISRWIEVPIVEPITQYCLPGNEDVALARLERPIPEDAAIPARVQMFPVYLSTLMPSDLAGWHAGKEFRCEGYGAVEGGRPAPQRQFGRFRDVNLKGAPSVFEATGIDGASTRPGDSGGGWFWRDERTSSTQFDPLVGVTQRASNVFISIMSQGGVDSEGNSKPDLGAWLATHLNQDLILPTTFEDGQPGYRGLPATGVGLFGWPEPYAVALFGITEPDENCWETFDPDDLALKRSSETWILTDNRRGIRLWAIPGSWQQAYTRGMFLINFLKGYRMTRICALGDRSDPSLVYFRGDPDGADVTDDFSPPVVRRSQGGIDGYDLASTADRAFAFDYDSSGNLDHIALYRPGKGIMWILKRAGDDFERVFENGRNGIGGYDLASEADRAFAFDYDSSNRVDHLVLYRPGTGKIWMMKKH